MPPWSVLKGPDVAACSVLSMILPKNAKFRGGDFGTYRYVPERTGTFHPYLRIEEDKPTSRNAQGAPRRDGPSLKNNNKNPKIGKPTLISRPEHGGEWRDI
jgi:hypothetical protein